MCLFLFRFEVHVSSTDTVESVKEKVAASQLIAFPEHKLMFKGEKMEEGKTLSDYGIQESMGLFGKCESCPFMLRGRGRSAVRCSSWCLRSAGLRAVYSGESYLKRWGGV